MTALAVSLSILILIFFSLSPSLAKACMLALLYSSVQFILPS